MAEATNKAKAAEKEEVFVPMGYANDEPNVFVSVNGKSYLLPKGDYSKVPSEVAEELKRSEKAKMKWDKRSREMAAKASK